MPSCLRAGRKRENACIGQNTTRPPPCMRWRGPRLATSRSARRLPGSPGVTRRPPVPGDPRDVPVSRPFPCPGVSPGRFPFPTVKVFLLLSPPSRKGLREFILGFFRVHTISTEGPWLSARCVGYPRAYAQLIHKLHNVIRRVLI